MTQRLLLIAIAYFLGITSASALCNINTLFLTVSPNSANAGTYTPPNAPVAQSVTLKVSGTYYSLLGGTCTLGIAFSDPTNPPQMTIAAGTTTMPYVVRTLANGGNSLVYTGAAPSSGNVMQASFQAALLGIPGTFSLNYTIYFPLRPNSPQLAGSYSDSLTLHFFDVQGVALTDLGSRTFLVSGTVNKVCTIGGLARPGADSATIAISADGQVSTAPIQRSYANVGCNIRSSVQLTSQQGAVISSASVPSGFTNRIDYAAGATFSGAEATLDTSDTAGSTGPESGSAVSTTGATPNGTLAVTITPKANTSALVAGGYADTLTITLTPQ